MKINTDSIITATEAARNFARTTAMAEKKGHVIIFKNNRPKYMIIDLEKEPQIEMSDDEKLQFVAKRILKKHIAAFRELAE